MPRTRRHTSARHAVAAIGAIGVVAATLAAGPAHAAPVPTMGPGPVGAGMTEVDLLNINDFHGRIDSDGTGKLGKGFACTIETQRQSLGEANTLLLGAGDLIGASPFTSASQQDVPTIEFLNAMGLNASGVGNHEFDRGFPDLRDRVIPMANFNYLGANVYFKGTTTPALQTYRLFTVNGIRVAVVGAVTSETPSLVGADGIADLTFGDPVTGVNRVAAQLKDGDPANGEADVVIAEFHEGAPVGSPQSTFDVQHADSAVFAHLVDDTSDKVDVLMQGHTHQTYMWDAPIPGRPGETRPVLQTGNYASNLGRIKLGVDPSTRKVMTYESVIIPVTPTDICAITSPRLTAANQIIDTAVAKANLIGQQTIGSVTADVTTAYAGTPPKRDDRMRESTLSNAIAQSQVDSLNAPGRPGGVDIGVMNPGGVRAELLYGTDGKITFAQAATIMPFGNTIKTTELTGAQFKQVLEEQWQPAGASRPFLKLGLSDDVTYTYDQTKAAGARVTSVWFKGAPMDPAKKYVVAANSFLIPASGDGGDNFFTMGRGTNEKDSGLVDQNMFVDWIKSHSPISPNFAKHAVGVYNAPTTLTAGQEVSFETEGYDLTSLGSPSNATVAISVGGVPAGTATITHVGDPLPGIPTRNGKATIAFTVPAGVPAGATSITLVAAPTNTTVNIPVTMSVPAPTTYTPVTPSRVVDTTTGLGAPQAQVPAGGSLNVKLTGLGGIPATGVKAVVINLTAVSPAASGHLTAYAAGQPQPSVSNVSYTAGHSIANQAIVPVNADGTITVTSSARTDVTVDLTGYFPTGSVYTPVNPTRIADTTAGLGVPTGPVSSRGTLDVQVTGVGGVPATGVGEVVLNVTARQPVAAGSLTVWPAGDPKPGTSDLSYALRTDTSALVIAKVGADGKVSIAATSRTDVAVDVVGWFPTDSEYHPIAAQRLLSAVPVAAGGTLTAQVTGGAVPADATAVMVTVSISKPRAPGQLITWATGAARPDTSTQHYLKGESVSNTVLAQVGTDGKISVYSSAHGVVSVDVTGYVK